MAETAVVQAQKGEKKNIKDRSVGFFSEVAKEMRKVSWPKRNELVDATVITLVVCIVLAAFVFLADKVFETVINFLFNTL